MGFQQTEMYRRVQAESSQNKGRGSCEVETTSPTIIKSHNSRGAGTEQGSKSPAESNQPAVGVVHLLCEIKARC